MQLAGKTVLLTGGSAGIGRELARQLKAKGAQVVLTGRNVERLDFMRAEGFETIRADLSNAAGVDALVAELGERSFDVLINNAGQLIDHDFRKGSPDPDAADEGIYANLQAPIRLIAAMVPMLKARPEAAIVNVTSGLAIAPASRQPIYCATKAGLRSYTLALRQQLADTKIRVIEALPPVVDTQMNADNAMSKMPAEECARQIVSAIENNHDEANIGQVKLLRLVDGISPALARRIMIRF
ncbi:SDR family oxidoreductase [Parerythrobacter lacustris]|uniref:SDR family NAD(P)-dependent oxidoreductase n=1 Tax=Parerythrobacter lacustris TaxID=2969984 RepID=A0ABT1XR01_9SPHN|nr:SDR family NAD(P)-dependent oxidoreductase [Parerythrobacter lacustris]MCR2834088.1 SDR family NAD(P)-dependent oxidoreductase [Parerythrobacter lacustris]